MAKDYGFGSLGMGPMAGMLGSMDFMKNAWSSFSLPSNLAPTMDVDELDRRITDLKAVEQWLDVNLALLRSSIQAMEIQRGTIAAIQAFSESMASSGEPGDAAARAIDAVAAMQRAAGQAASAPARRETGGRDNAATGEPRAPVGEPAAQPQPEDDSQSPESTTPDSARGAGADRAARESSPGAAGAGVERPSSIAGDLSQAAAAAVNPSAWWNMLQSQFNQVAQAALAAAGPGAQATAAKAAGESASAANKAAPRKKSPAGATTDPGSGARAKRSAPGKAPAAKKKTTARKPRRDSGR